MEGDDIKELSEEQRSLIEYLQGIGFSVCEYSRREEIVDLKKIMSSLNFHVLLGNAYVKFEVTYYTIENVYKTAKLMDWDKALAYYYINLDSPPTWDFITAFISMTAAEAMEMALRDKNCRI
jgi:hypothetical protein